MKTPPSNQLPRQLPATRRAALKLLRDLNAKGLTWHLDDDPRDIVHSSVGLSLHPEMVRTFTDEDAEYIEMLIPQLNHLFADCPAPHTINAGAWNAVERAGWLKGVGLYAE